MTATKLLKGGVKFEVWKVGVDFGGEWSEKRTYNVKVRVPIEGFVGPPVAQQDPGWGE